MSADHPRFPTLLALPDVELRSGSAFYSSSSARFTNAHLRTIDQSFPKVENPDFGGE
jgi:hypothetical protein